MLTLIVIIFLLCWLFAGRNSAMVFAKFILVAFGLLVGFALLAAALG